MVAERGVLPPQERIPERICEQIADVHVRQVVEQVLEVPKNSSQDRNPQDTVEQIPDDPVLEKAEQLVEVPETVSRDGVQQRTVEQIVDAPVPQAVEELAEVSRVFSQDGIQQRIVEQTIPAIPLTEKIVEKPIIQEKINQVTKHVEIPELQFNDKVVDNPVVAQRQISMETVQKNIEIPQLQHCDEVVDVPAVLVVAQIPQVHVVMKTAEIPQLQVKVVNVPVVLVVPVPQVRVGKKTVEDLQLQIVEKIIEIAELLRFNTSGDEQINLKEYVDRMKEGQNDMCYVTDESIAVVSSLFEENLRKKGHEVPYMTDPVDEKKTLEELKAKLEPLTELMKEVLGDKVVDDRTVDLLRVLTTSGHGLSVNMKCIMKAQAPVDNANVSTNTFDRLERQQHSSKQQQQPQTARQPTRQEREKERGERKKERKEKEEREAEEGRGEQVKKDVTDWTVVTRNKRQRKMAQIFVKVNGSKATPMEVNLTDDKVEDVMRQIQKDEDVYVTMHGKVLRRDEKLKSCEVTDGCTIQVTSRLRGGGKHKDKRSKADTKQGMDKSGQKDQQVESLIDKCQEATQDQKDVMIQLFEENDAYRRMITMISEAEDEEHEIQRFGKQLQSGVDEERAKLMKLGMRWAVEARKRGRGAEQEQRQQEEQRQRRHEEQGQNTGRGSAGLVRGGDERCRTDETSRKGKGKGNGGKGEHDGKAGGAGSKGRQQVENLVMDEDQENMRATTSEENHEEDLRKLLEMVEKEEMELEMMRQEEMEHEEQRGRVAPNMGAGGSHPQATSDPRKKKKETRKPRWADCEDDERQEEGKKEQETEKETRQETGQEELTNEKPPGLEQKEDEKKEEKEKRAQEAREDEERRAQEAREEERRAQEAREEQRRAQEAREKEKRAQEAREEERRAQEAREEESRVQEAQAREAKAQEEREREMKAQEEREREVSAHEERREQDREVEAQGGMRMTRKPRRGMRAK